MIGVLMSKKILIADDEQNIVISIEFLLRREGFEVLVAGDGEERWRRCVPSDRISCCST
jgi:DNA-binding response OmpR family regulator